MSWIAALLRAREHDGADRLLLTAARGAGDTGDRDDGVRTRNLQRALRHAPGDGDRHRPEGFQHVTRNLEKIELHVVGIADYSAFEYVR